MSDESQEELERKNVVKDLRDASLSLKKVEDVNEQWGLVNEEILKDAKEAVWKMIAEADKYEKEIS